MAPSRSRRCALPLAAAASLAASCAEPAVTPDARATDAALPTRDALPTSPDVLSTPDAPAVDASALDAPASRAYAFDLDADGTPETDLALTPCAAAPAASLCLRVDSARLAAREIRLADQPDRCTGTVLGVRLRPIGHHTGDTLAEVAAVFCPNDGTAAPPTLAVIDVAAGAVVARTSAPRDKTHAWVEYVRDPAGRLHPFLAPSYGDGDTSGFYGTTVWGRLCLYRADAPGGGAVSTCGRGFVAGRADPQPAFFREVGGYLQDMDGDGWEDVTLTYHALAHTVSGATGAVLATTEYDVALSTEPGAPRMFHSGRNYGTHAASAEGATLRASIVAGAPVGTFGDVNCNVSRFLAVLDAPRGRPAARALRWANYQGFASTIFSAYDPMYAADPSVVVARPADVMHHCVHRFSDSRAVMDGQPVLAVNYFRQDAPVDRCLREQYQLYLPPAWTPEKQRIWNECFARNLRARGVWGLLVVREADGAGLTGSLNTYVWGRARGLLPTSPTEDLYLVEVLPGAGAFNLSDRTPSALSVRALVRGLWVERGVFPRPGRPRIRQDPGGGPRGVGSFTYFAELTTRDVDGDGLDEVQLEDGAWVGYSRGSGRFEVKP